MFAEIFFVTIIGLVLGSFSSALIYRIPRKMDWTRQRSFCPSCEKKLKIADLIPIFSWLAAGGKCGCGARISGKYPLLELTHAVLLLCAYFVFGLNLEFLWIAAALPILISLLFIDLEFMILPNILVAILAASGLLRACFLSFTGGDSLILGQYVFAGLLYGVFSWGLGWILTKALKKEALGFGDDKFFAAAGLWLGITPFPYFLMLSGFMGVFCGFLWQLTKKTSVFPFGPALIVSLYILLV